MPETFIVATINHLPIEQITACPTNPHVHTDQQVAQIAASIAEFSFVNPILIGDDGSLLPATAAWPRLAYSA
jgi:ParB-like chromosome segregation protein Spo0J